MTDIDWWELEEKLAAWIVSYASFGEGQSKDMARGIMRLLEDEHLISLTNGDTA